MTLISIKGFAAILVQLNNSSVKLYEALEMKCRDYASRIGEV
jgi:hypothetical protein